MRYNIINIENKVKNKREEKDKKIEEEGIEIHIAANENDYQKDMKSI